MANPIVTITMENGDVMKAELYPEIAPITVENFVNLVKDGFYDGLTFHRIINGFMIQGGCPWHVQCIRIQQEASSLSCTKLLHI